MKILTICEGGNNRSVCLAFFMKDELGHDAISMGIRRAGRSTKKMLYEWADKIILVDKAFQDEIPKKFKRKLLVWDVGPDRYGFWWHPELIQQYQNYITTQLFKLN